MVNHIFDTMETYEGDNHHHFGDDRRVALINELSRGKELALQLQAQLTRRFDDNGKSSIITQAAMLDEIFSCYNNVLSIINDEDDDEPETSPRRRRCRRRYKSGAVGAGGGDGDGFSGGDWSAEKPDQKDGRPNTNRKKMLPRWSESVKIQAGKFDGAPRDGHSWRKYGQKKILGAAHPRNYYRCTHRHTQDCLATKHVQQSDADPTLVQVIYQGHHTCQHNHHPVTLQLANTSNPVHILEPAPSQPLSPLLQISQPAAPPTHLIEPRHHHHAELEPAAGPSAIPDSSADQGRFEFRSFSFSSSAFLEPDIDLLTDVFFSAPPPAAGATPTATADVLGSPGWPSVVRRPARSVSGCSVGSNPEPELSEALSTGCWDPAAALVAEDLAGEGDGFGFMELDELGISDDVEFEFDDVEA